MFYFSPDDIKCDMKLFFADHFPLLLVLGLMPRLNKFAIQKLKMLMLILVDVFKSLYV